MNKASIGRLALTTAVAIGLAGAVAAPAAATPTNTGVAVVAPAYEDEWDRVWEFGNDDLCEAAGHTGEALGIWEDDEWYCDEDGTLYVAR